jgi:hypothetical protein
MKVLETLRSAARARLPEEIKQREGINERTWRHPSRLGKHRCESANHLYGDSRSSFEAYCRDRWDMSQHYANYQIQAAEIAGNLATTVTKPTAERHLRPLAGLGA